MPWDKNSFASAYSLYFTMFYREIVINAIVAAVRHGAHLLQLKLLNVCLLKYFIVKFVIMPRDMEPVRFS
jgi:hypothetical protein